MAVPSITLTELAERSGAPQAPAPPDIEPLAQERRFRSAAWQRWP
ncbi:hypothetical protein [Massilia violaceinigra]|nr:hypothetical protein [Massilia violaceinigra]